MPPQQPPTQSPYGQQPPTSAPQSPHAQHDFNPNRQGSPDDDMYKPEYAHLNLSAGEKVLMEVPRHPLGQLQFYISALIGIIAVIIGASLLIRFSGTAANAPVASQIGSPVTTEQIISVPEISTSLIFLIAGVLVVLVTTGAAIALKVYNGNKMYITNESVIQMIQTSLFNKKEQQIGLAAVEDISYVQAGIIGHMLNFGNIRLSTRGEESTYIFSFVADPKAQVRQMINIQEEFERKMHAPMPHPTWQH